jgi:hypothetical protein
VVVDSAGNQYYAAVNAYMIKKITPAGIESTFAGSGSNTVTDATGTSAGFMQPTLLAIDSSDNLYVADGFYIRKITPGAVVSTLVNLGSGDIRGLAANTTNVYFVNNFSTQTHQIQQVPSAGGSATLLAGGSVSGTTDAVGASARFSSPASLAVDSGGNIYVADTGNFLIRKVTAAGVTTTFAGTVGVPGYADGVGTAATFSFWNQFTPMAVDSLNNIYIGNMDGSTHNSIKKMAPDGTVSTYCGPGSTSTSGDCSLNVFSRFGLGISSTGAIYYADGSVLKKISPP